MRKRGEQVHLVMSDCYEKLVPGGHFLRKLDAAIDFSFIEDLCRDKYRVEDGGPGRPAEPPVEMDDDMKVYLPKYIDDQDSDCDVILGHQYRKILEIWTATSNSLIRVTLIDASEYL
jgi:hypothetical protein